MKSLYLVRAAGALALMTSLSGIAYAQAWVPGSEIVGQPVTVTTNGVSNTVYLDPGGSARIMTPGGNTVAGTWSAANGQLCLSTGAAQECFPYASPFQAGQPLTLTSSCGSSATWLASATNTALPQGQRGERGR
ncbi:hypothetical protein [Sphingomonas sp. URHD0057]|uniref:hypothetical protein n=1 Tax=Sphingomonas sp. URHD0057 TaxID=1380389 RepID=UPI00048CD231|nr:hypothetical protein [Sphingomonas sp. URHD0057]